MYIVCVPLQAKLPNLKDVDVRYTEAWWSAKLSAAPLHAETHTSTITHCTQTHTHITSTPSLHQEPYHHPAWGSPRLIRRLLWGGAVTSFITDPTKWHRHREGTLWNSSLLLPRRPLLFFCFFLQTTSENERTRCTEILEPCSLCPYPLPRPFIRSLSVFIITLFFFPLSACAPHNEIPNRGRLHLPGTSRWRLPLMERRLDAAARLPVRLWSDPRCSSPDGRGQLLSSPRSLFAVSFQDQIPAFSNLSLGKWGATSEKRRLCLLLMYNSRKGEKKTKTVFINLN